MASFQAVKKVVNLAPTVRALPTGIPVAPLLNLAARAPTSGHEHAHSASVPRADVQPQWAGGVSRTSCGLISKTFINGKYCLFLGLCQKKKRPKNTEINLKCSPDIPKPPVSVSPLLGCRKRSSGCARLFSLPCQQFRQQPCALLLHGWFTWRSIRVCRQI